MNSKPYLNNPSLANCDLLRVGEEIEELMAGGVNMVHIDIMDGHYVPNLCFPVSFVRAVKRRFPSLLADIHLMATNPEHYIEPLAECGADYTSFHLDSTSFPIRLLGKIKSCNMKAGVVINPSQCVGAVEPVLDLLDYAVLMSVEPGFAGQQFLAGSHERLEKLVSLRERSTNRFLISVDGGITTECGIRCANAGADMLVTNIYTVFNQPDGITGACRRFTRELNKRNL